MDITSLASETNEDLYIGGNHCNHTPWPNPQMLSLESITSLLTTTIVSSSSGLKACPMDATLANLGLNSFDIIRIANQIRDELDERLGSHDCHMSMLLEKLFDCKVGSVAEYIASELSSWHQHRGARDQSVDEEYKAKKRPTFQDSDLVHISKRLKPGPEVFTEAMASAEDHVTVQKDHVTTVESWRRGQYFINGKYVIIIIILPGKCIIIALLLLLLLLNVVQFAGTRYQFSVQGA